MTIGSDTYNKPDRAALYKRNKAWLLLVAFISGAAGLYLAWTRGWGYFSILLIMMLLGMSYTRAIVPLLFLWTKNLPNKGCSRVKDHSHCSGMGYCYKPDARDQP